MIKKMTTDLAVYEHLEATVQPAPIIGDLYTVGNKLKQFASSATSAATTLHMTFWSVLLTLSFWGSLNVTVSLVVVSGIRLFRLYQRLAAKAQEYDNRVKALEGVVTDLRGQLRRQDGKIDRGLAATSELDTKVSGILSNMDGDSKMERQRVDSQFARLTQDVSITYSDLKDIKTGTEEHHRLMDREFARRDTEFGVLRSELKQNSEDQQHRLDHQLGLLDTKIDGLRATTGKERAALQTFLLGLINVDKVNHEADRVTFESKFAGKMAKITQIDATFHTLTRQVEDVMRSVSTLMEKDRKLATDPPVSASPSVDAKTRKEVEENTAAVNSIREQLEQFEANITAVAKSLSDHVTDSSAQSVQRHSQEKKLAEHIRKYQPTHAQFRDTFNDRVNALPEGDGHGHLLAFVDNVYLDVRNIRERVNATAQAVTALETWAGMSNGRGSEHPRGGTPRGGTPRGGYVPAGHAAPQAHGPGGFGGYAQGGPSSAGYHTPPVYGPGGYGGQQGFGSSY
jgi:uncharacterized protein YoxC